MGKGECNFRNVGFNNNSLGIVLYCFAWGRRCSVDTPNEKDAELPLNLSVKVKS